MANIQLSNGQRGFIQPLLPLPVRTRRPRSDAQWTFEGVFYVLITDCR